MSQYAIIQSGNKQYTVKSGDTIDVELLDINPDEVVEFKEVLLFQGDQEVKIGAPYVENALVKGKVQAAVRGPKVIAYKYKKRKNYRRKKGHRQNYTRVLIEELNYVT